MNLKHGHLICWRISFYIYCIAAECQVNRWGENCLRKCSVNCLNNTCHNVTGYCEIGCHSMYFGPDCSKNAVAVSLLFVAAVICGVVGMAVKRSKKTNQLVIFSKLRSYSAAYQQKNAYRFKDQMDMSEALDHPMTSANVAVTGDETLIGVTQLQEFLRSHDSNFFEEQFLKIPDPNNVTHNVGLSLENREKNRYKDFLPYDHSRVRLEVNKDKGEEDYINASFVEGYKNRETFIASQGPKAAIVNDFVRMLWEQKVQKVVMLTNLNEDSKIKCEKYWPDEGSLVFGNITVRLMSTQGFADYTIRRVQLIKPDHAPQEITQYHFTSWPDKGVTLTPWGLVEFEQRVFNDVNLKPVVVHCSAGVGRTGTFIALRNVMKQAEETGQVDFFTTTAMLRQARMMMIQTVEQYKFLHQAALVAIVCMGTTITAADIKERMNALDKMSDTGKTHLEKEFQAVCSVIQDAAEKASTIEHAYAVISEKCVEIQGESNRAVMVCGTKHTVDGMNSVLVSSFNEVDKFILAQIPQTSTVIDFWRLVTEYDVEVVVAFELEDSENETFDSYLPINIHAEPAYPPFIIESVTTERKETCVEQHVIVTLNQTGSSEDLQESKIHNLITLHCFISEDDPNSLLTTILLARGIMSRQNGKVAFLCRNGAMYSGLACVLISLLDRLDNDLCVSVPLVVGAVKSIRSEVIPTLDQYHLVYQTLDRYIETSKKFRVKETFRPSVSFKV